MDQLNVNNTGWGGSKRVSFILLGFLVATQYICRQYGLSGRDHLLSFAADCFSYSIAKSNYPTPDLAPLSGTALSALTLAAMLGKGRYADEMEFWALTRGCTLQTKLHYGPGANETWEGWADGENCISEDAQSMTVGDGALVRLTQNGLKDKCHVACMRPLPDPHADGRQIVHGFLSSAPGGQVPDESFCGRVGWQGNCPVRDDAGGRRVPHGSVTPLRIYSTHDPTERALTRTIL